MPECAEQYGLLYDEFLWHCCRFDASVVRNHHSAFFDPVVFWKVGNWNDNRPLLADPVLARCRFVVSEQNRAFRLRRKATIGAVVLVR